MKNIAFFADGTWNGPGEDHDGDGRPDDPQTNVFKLFCALDGTDSADSLRLQNEQERFAAATAVAPAQAAKYIHGVGDSRNPLVKLLGGGLGAGMLARILRGYTFISRNYEPGDSIYLIGFSRGAYTVRALGGLICRMGLLNKAAIDLADKENAYRYATAAWHRYRQETKPKSAGVFAAFIQTFERIAALDDTKIESGHLVSGVEIAAIGVWDTVGALGIPNYEGRQRIDDFGFADNVLSPKVGHGFHAVAVDERRDDFAPTLWDEVIEPRHPGILQVWFHGAHANIGGGYANTDLSDLSLRWMADQLRQRGLRLQVPDDGKPGAAVPQVAPDEPWKEAAWVHRPAGPRTIPDAARIHQTVVMRLAAGVPSAASESLRPLLHANMLKPTCGIEPWR